MVQYAKFDYGSAWLGKDFGVNLAAKLFPEVAIASLPTNVKGKYVGKCKATLEWVKCIEGGWVKDTRSVENRVGKIIGARIIIRPFRGPIQVLHEMGDISRLRDY